MEVGTSLHFDRTSTRKSKTHQPLADRIRQQLYPSQGASATTKPPVLAETPQPAVDSTLATTIQAILSNPDLTAETRNAAILALTVPQK